MPWAAEAGRGLGPCLGTSHGLGKSGGVVANSAVSSADLRDLFRSFLMSRPTTRGQVMRVRITISSILQGRKLRLREGWCSRTARMAGSPMVSPQAPRQLPEGGQEGLCPVLTPGGAEGRGPSLTQFTSSGSRSTNTKRTPLCGRHCVGSCRRKGGQGPRLPSQRQPRC